jgi:hypothetical protein
MEKLNVLFFTDPSNGKQVAVDLGNVVEIREQSIEDLTIAVTYKHNPLDPRVLKLSLANDGTSYSEGFEKLIRLWSGR